MNKKTTIAIPAEDVKYVESIRVYNVKIPDYYISRKELEEEIAVFSKHCENKKAQNMCSACIVLGDLLAKLKLK